MGRTLPQSAGWMGDPTRGAALGRMDNRAPVPQDERWTLQRVRIDRAGYDTGGAYWGTGRPLYWASAGTAELFFRASDRADAKASVRREYPDARFLR